MKKITRKEVQALLKDVENNFIEKWIIFYIKLH